MVAQRIPLDGRFWSKVEKIPFLECWIWTGALHEGYGQMRAGKDHGQKMLYAHRLSYADAAGIPYDEAEHVHHECRMRPCIRPDHLRDKTVKEHLGGHCAEIAALYAKAEVCFHGHSLADAYVPPVTKRRPTAVKRCRTCRRIAAAASEVRRAARPRPR